VQTLHSAENIAAGLKSFTEDSDISEFLVVCKTIIQELEAVVTRFLPDEVNTEVAKYITALDDAVEGFDEAMEAFVAGDTTGSMEALYKGIRSATAGLLPESVQGDDAFGAVVGTLDSVFNNLSSTVLRYRQALLQSSVCWKTSVGRERKRPDECPADTNFDGKSWCVAQVAASLLDTAARRKGKKNKPGVAPSCSDDGEFSEHRGAWCYKDCPAGRRPSGWGHTQCRTSCAGDFPVDGPLMCGKSPGTVSAALMEKTVQTIRAILTAKALIESSGFAAALPGTATSLVDLGTSFAHPSCPVSGE